MLPHALSNPDLLTAMHKYGIELTASLQNGFPDFKAFLIWISVTFEPPYMYVIFSPILFALNPIYGIKMFWTAAISEWMNHVLKWVLNGERPYWWVQENEDLWSKESVPSIHQFSITCETTPGSPSGHVMVNGASLFIFMKGILMLFNHKRRLPQVIGWLTYSLVMFLIATSRVYIAAHFPHQCVAGLLSGLALGYFLENITIEKMNLATHLKILIGVLSTALGIFACLICLGVDPNWSITLAAKWCSHRDWIHPNTTPFYIMWRYSGTLLGMALTLSSSMYKTSSQFHISLTGAVVIASINAIVCLVCSSAVPSSAHIVAIYAAAFSIHALIPFLVMGPLKCFIGRYFINLKSQ